MKTMLTQTDTQVMERMMRRVVNEIVNDVVNRKLEEKLKPLNDFAEGATLTLGNILDELQKIHDQRLGARVEKLESLHPDGQHNAVIA